MDSVVIDYGLDPSGYMTGIGQVMAGNTSLQQSMNNVTTGSTLMSKALSMVTPGRVATGALMGFAATAANTQKQLSGLEATSAVTGVSVGKLGAGIRQIAKDFPIGSSGAAQLVTQFTRMGIAGQGSEGQILKLSTSVAKMAGATGESASTIADGMTTLSRVTGNTNLNTKRFDALGDSLTTVSLKSGASAGGILALSKNIAPMASVAGIGATGILGISSAFARLGEDGIGASTAVNKMLGDMNKSVRDGSPEIMKYAQIVGKTTTEFTALFKANPTEAITQVTEALAKAGSAGPRQLESIGLEGVRTQRQLQGVMSTGGLRTPIADAIGAYGSGSSAKASEAAYGGLNDSLGELQSASGDLATAFGAPLLSPLTTFTKGLTNATGFLGKMVGSDKGQTALKVVGGLAAGAMIAKTLVSGAATLGIGRQMATSGLVRSYAGAWAAGKGNEDSRLGRFGGRATFLANSQVNDQVVDGKIVKGYGLGGQLGHEIDPKTGQSVMERDSDKRSTTYGQNIPKMRPLGNAERAAYMRTLDVSRTLGPGDGGPGMLKRLSTGLRQYGGNAALTYIDSARKNLGNQYGPNATDAFGRQNAWVPSAGFKAAGAAMKAAAPDSFFGGAMSRDGIKAFNNAMVGMSAETVSLKQVFGSLAKGAGQATMQLASVGRGAAFGALKGGAQVAGLGIKKVAGSALALAGGGVGLALMGGMAAYSQYQQEQTRRSDAGKEYTSRDISTSLNTYREQAGQATKAVVTVTQIGSDYAKGVANSVKTLAQAQNVTGEDMAAGALTKDKVVQKFKGTNEQIAAQVSGLSATGLNANDMQNAKIDLARQMPNQQSDIQKIMDLVAKKSATAPDEAPKKLTGSGGKDLSTALAPWISQGPDAEAYKTTGWRSFSEGLTSNGRSGMDSLNANVANPDWAKATQFGVGGGQHESRLNEKTKAGLTAVMDQSNQRKAQQGTTFGANYAQQEQYKGWNTMMADTAKSGDAESYSALARKMSLTVNKDANEGKGFDISPDLVKAKGGVAQALASLDPTFAKNYAGYTKEQSAQSGGQFSAYEKQSIDSQTIAKSSPTMSKFFDYRDAKPGSSQALSAKAAETPEDLSLLDAAVKSMTHSTDGSAKALGDLESQAAAASSGLTAGSPAQIQAAAVQARAGAMKQDAYKDLTPSQVMIKEIPNLLKLVQNRDNTTEGAKQREEGLTGLRDMKDQLRPLMTARVQAQRSADVGKGLAREDYGIARGYQIKDYNTQVMRTNRDFNKNLARSEFDFEKSRSRAIQDYGIARVRQSRDFNIQVARTEQDFQISRFRSLRDFNISLKREIEDSASTMYDPYSRIQTKPTWDSANMTANIEEQTAALVKQKRQLDELRKAGLSSKSIDQLGLGKAENAQQVDNLASDAITDPRGVAKLNAAAAAKSSAAGALTLDSSNKDLRRSREDLAKTFKDNEDDLKKNLARSRVDLSKNLNDQASDFRKNLDRTSTDYKISLVRNAFDLKVALGDMEYQQNLSLDRQERAFTLSLGRIDRALLEADKSVGQDFKTLSNAYNKAIHGTAITWGTTMKNDSAALIATVSNDLVPGLKAAWADAGLPLPAAMSSSTPSAAQQKATGAKQQRFAQGAAEGGTIMGTSAHDKADDKLIRATAGEFMQPVSTVKHYGVNAMEAIRTKRVPKELINGYYDGGLIAFGKKLQKQDFQVSEHPLFGGVTAGAHTPGSWHYRGGAIDVNHDQGNEKSAIDAIVKGARAFSLRTIWQVASHFDHAHFDIGSGPDMVGQGYPGGGTGGGTGGGSASSSGATGLSKAAIDKVMKLAPKKGPFFNNLLKHFEDKLRDTYQDAGGSGGGATFAGLGSGSGNAEKVFSTLRGLGFSDQAAAGVVGNLMQESGVNPKSQQSGGPGRGIMQWSEGQRWSNLQRWAGKQDPWALATQVGFMVKEMNDRSFTGGYKGLTNVDEATTRFEQVMEAAGTPNMANRIAQANNAMKAFSKKYDDGGKVKPGMTMVRNDTGKPEALLNPKQWEMVSALLTKEEAGSLNTAGGMHMTVNHNETITYDNRNDFGGSQITVQAQDPDQMGRALEARQTRSRLTQTRGVRAR